MSRLPWIARRGRAWMMKEGVTPGASRTGDLDRAIILATTRP